jgi:hypothetical protein
MHPDDDKDSGLPGPAMVLALLASVAIIIILAGYQAGQILAWLIKLLTA